MRRRLTAASRNTSVGGFITYTKDSFGRTVSVYNDLPILIIDTDNEGNSILGFDEVGATGSTATATSIYCVSLNDGMLGGIQSGTMMATDLGELETKPVYRTRIEWYAGIACYHGRAAARLGGIKDAPVVA